MSLITSCPACGTMFRVVPDQLKISEGWVRCGHCAEVFDASAHLTSAAVLPSVPAPSVPDAAAGADDPVRGWESTSASGLASLPVPLLPTAPEAPPVPVPAPAPAQSTTPAAPTTPPAFTPPPAPATPVSPTRPVPLTAPPSAAPFTAAPPEPSTAPVPLDGADHRIDADSRFGPDSQALEPSSLDAPFVFRRSDFDHGALPSVLPPAPDSQLQEEQDDDDATESELQQVSFVRDARRKAVWRRPLVRLALAFFSLLLATALVLQLAYHERDRLAVLQPELRPLLVRMCGYFDCTLAHPRQIEAIVIDSSGFNRLRGDTYRLTFNVRNTGATRVATPSLELTLTDAQDQPLLRRVLSPQELGATAGFIPAASEWSGVAGVVVSPTSGVRVSGYRLLAFYP